MPVHRERLQRAHPVQRPADGARLHLHLLFIEPLDADHAAEQLQQRRRQRPTLYHLLLNRRLPMLSPTASAQRERARQRAHLRHLRHRRVGGAAQREIDTFHPLTHLHPRQNIAQQRAIYFHHFPCQHTQQKRRAFGRWAERPGRMRGCEARLAVIKPSIADDEVEGRDPAGMRRWPPHSYKRLTGAVHTGAGRDCRAHNQFDPPV
mmetsp:Transcript_4002/g.12550  ORF Transcript_4002/g.12550 Transcript_4002/m.12550 type:complete len:206 (-) Transcript_4002:4-621(-)